MYTVTNRPAAREQGFTLLELSIVLVIIGLIVGGVLVGQDLIKAAEVRATVGQYEKLNSTVNTFRTKYNGIPGDINATKAATFGLFSTGMTGAAGLGDGNGLIQDNAGGITGIGETAVFWRHLSDANLIDASLGGSLGGGGAPPGGVIGTLLPAKLGRGNFWTVFATGGLNYYQLTAPTDVASDGTYTLTSKLTPIEAYNIDLKVDDGKPMTGVVIAAGGTTVLNDVPTFNASPGAGDCTTGSTATDPTDTYATGTTPGNAPGCQIRMRFN